MEEVSVNTTCPIFLGFGITRHFACCRTGLGKLRVICIFTHPVNKGQVHIYWPCQCRNLSPAVFSWRGSTAPTTTSLPQPPAVQHLAALSQHRSWWSLTEPHWAPHHNIPVPLVSSCCSFSLQQFPTLAQCIASTGGRSGTHRAMSWSGDDGTALV